MTTTPASPADFYDRLAPFYHLVFPDWDASIQRQGEQLGALIEAQWPGCRRVLDVSCGIGTQAIALAQRGYCVSGAVSTTRLGELMREAGFGDVRCIDGVFYQPVLVGTRVA